jgi:hypothetical protein
LLRRQKKKKNQTDLLLMCLPRTARLLLPLQILNVLSTSVANNSDQDPAALPTKNNSQPLLSSRSVPSATSGSFALIPLISVEDVKLIYQEQAITANNTKI